MKQTKQKEFILNAVFSLHTHPAAADIYTLLKKDHERLSLGTVYRNLNKFAATGKIRKISVPGMCDRFDFRIDNHEHVYCEKCGKVFDVETQVDIGTLILPSCPVAITGYTLLFHGVCAQCKDC